MKIWDRDEKGVGMEEGQRVNIQGYWRFLVPPTDLYLSICAHYKHIYLMD